ncbi:GDP-L-fucose synthase [Trichlorobacter lovleyi]|uniref:GDP-L-fucose synthase family protein n=1 Tax=Trichlorobacter lovleyi TaxID=313985 RepID=UPI00223F7A3D|nr:GDP-L-fucose synthase [Trichlorobacter lovleyi]QOX79707.1 GDP-L-fucose synthase [Trichlorobacter lovleyi]
MRSDAKIFVAGHRGMVGSAIVRKLEQAGYSNLLLKSSAELDLRNQSAVAAFFEQHKPDYVFLAAARVGGIIANSTRKAEFIYDNLMIQTNVIHEAWKSGVQRLLFLGSTCIYPKFAPQPIREADLLTSPLEPSNDAYAVAKIAGIVQCRSYNQQYGTRFLAAMPNNLYGPGDNYDLTGSHVLPALLRKFHEAKQSGSPNVTVWGTGTPLREFMHVDDLADASLFLMLLDDERYGSILTYSDAPALINVGSGQEISIADLARMVQQVVGFEGELVFDTDKPDGTPRKLANSSRLHALGWKHRIELEEGVRDAYRWFVGHVFP